MKSKTYARLYDDFYDGEEFHDLSLSAVGLWCRCLSYCNARKTDGNITLKMIRSLSHHNPNTKRTLTELLNSGLFIETATGYKFKTWVPFQASRAEIEHKQKYDKERHKKLQQEKIDDNDSELTDVNTNTITNTNLNTITNTSTREEEILKEEENNVSYKNYSYSSEDIESYFAEFYEIYPRKVGYKKAKQEFIEASSEVGVETIFQGLSNFMNDPARAYEEEFIPYPATWLRDARWEDEYDYLQEEDEEEE